MNKEQQYSKDAELTKDESELVLKALSYYQVHLFDEVSKQKVPDTSLVSDYKKTTVVIKKIHKTIEPHNRTSV